MRRPNLFWWSKKASWADWQASAGEHCRLVRVLLLLRLFGRRRKGVRRRESFSASLAGGQGGRQGGGPGRVRKALLGQGKEGEGEENQLQLSSQRQKEAAKKLGPDAGNPDRATSHRGQW